ncbi:hypothetical protein [Candidatus Palauibacter sp.]|uniref:hypothetical protein n=1 Tax=Candidatus Palauibacter sp. TaxID=3101350 RepID=UPI003B51D11F
MSAAAKFPGGAAGFGLIEVALAVTVASIGILGAAGVVLGIGSQARLAARDTDRTLAGRGVIQGLVREGHAAATSGAGIAEVGGRRHDVSRVVTTRSPRLRHVQVTITPPLGPDAAFEILLARERPMPVAP